MGGGGGGSGGGGGEGGGGRVNRPYLGLFNYELGFIIIC